MDIEKLESHARMKQMDGIKKIEFSRGGITEYLISAIPNETEPFGDFLQRILTCAVPSQTQIIHQDIYGLKVPAILSSLSKHPVTWIEPLNPSGNALAGTQIWAIQGTDVKQILHNGRTAGCLFEDEFARYFRLGGLGTGNPALKPEFQARNTFVEMENFLSQAGMNFHHVIRTWFYNHRILDWYASFNKVRTGYFRDHNIVLNEFPASTGIGSPNPSGSALTAGLLAVAGKGPDPLWKTVESPLQENPSKYGSSFSRAAELETPDQRRLLISGTAGISWDGRTEHVGNIDKQIELTMNVVQAILESRRMHWSCTTRAVAYFKEPGFVKSWIRWVQKQEIPALPVCLVHADVCRNDLLFEIELDAASHK